MNHDFKDKTVLVTGGTGELGKEVCYAFLSAGAKVATTYHSDNSIPVLQSRLGDMMKNVLLTRKNLSNEYDVENLVSEVVNKFGKIDVLANVIGGYIAGKGVSSINLEEWDQMMDLNLKTAFLLSKHVVSQMLKQSGGKIIHVSAKSGLKGSGFDAAYVVSKSGVIRLVESLSEEVKTKNINVNCIMPSIIDTETNRLTMPLADRKKWVTTQDIAKVILFLASNDSVPINGAAIPVYGLV